MPEPLNPCDRVEHARASRPPVKVPSRDDLARDLFVADNHGQPAAAALTEWADITEGGVEQYTHRLADAAIEAFLKANS